MHTIVSQRLREILNERNLSCSELSKLCDLSKSNISHYYNGQRIPNNKCANKMASVLDVSPAWLMGLDVPKYEDVNESDNAIILLRLFNKLDKEVQADVILLVRSICKALGKI